MKILISGSTGLIGSAAVDALGRAGHTVSRLVRPETAARASAPKPGEPAFGALVRWDPVGGDFDAQPAEGADAVVHLAGASIGDARWSDRRKRLLYTSRVDATRHLVRALAGLRPPPRVLVAASAIGYYGDRGDEELTEESAPGEDFLACLARDWEAESARAAGFGARVTMLRFGVILSRHGGALPRMLLPFRLGAGGRLGSGRQWMSWIALGDAIGALRFALEHDAVRGAVNAVAPDPVRNREFTKALGRALHRPALFPAPAFALRLALGEMADALLLSSQRVLPGKLGALGYNFQFSTLSEALDAALRNAAEKLPSESSKL